MWDTLYEILFNPNHEMPVGILIGIPIVAVLFNAIVPQYARFRAQQKQRNRVTGRKSKK